MDIWRGGAEDGRQGGIGPVVCCGGTGGPRREPPSPYAGPAREKRRACGAGEEGFGQAGSFLAPRPRSFGAQSARRAVFETSEIVNQGGRHVGVWKGVALVLASESNDNDSLAPRIIYVGLGGKLLLCDPDAGRPDRRRLRPLT